MASSKVVTGLGLVLIIKVLLAWHGAGFTITIILALFYVYISALHAGFDTVSIQCL